MSNLDIEVSLSGGRLIARVRAPEDVHILVSAPAPLPREHVERALADVADAIDTRASRTPARESRPDESALTRHLRRASERIRERERRRGAASVTQRDTVSESARERVRDPAPDRVRADGGQQ